MPDYSKEILDPRQKFRFKSLSRFLSYFGTDPRRLNGNRPAYLIISIKAGDGFCYVDGERIPLAAGSLLLVTPYMFLHLANVSYLLGSVVIFTEEFICQDHLSELLLYKTAYEPRVRPFVKFKSDDQKTQFINETLKMMNLEYRLSQSKGDFESSLYYGLLSVITQLHGKQLEKIGAGYDMENLYEKGKVISFIRLVNLYFREEKGLDLYAGKMNMSVIQLVRDCRKGCSWSPKAIIHAKILAEAKRLLAFDQRSVATIGFDLGFEELNAFTVFFRGHMKMSPSDYRNHVYSLQNNPHFYSPKEVI